MFPSFTKDRERVERESLASKTEFKKANKILFRIKSSGGRISLHDALDLDNISLWWWKDHKTWFLERFPYIRIDFDAEEEHPIKYFVNTEMIDD